MLIHMYSRTTSVQDESVLFQLVSHF